MGQSGPFRELITEYGSLRKETKDEKVIDKGESTVVPITESTEGKVFVLEEDRETGSVPLSTYAFFLRNVGSWGLLTLLGVTFMLGELALVSTTLWLGFWSGTQFSNLSQGAYVGIYACKCDNPTFWCLWLMSIGISATFALLMVSSA